MIGSNDTTTTTDSTETGNTADASTDTDTADSPPAPPEPEAEPEADPEVEPPSDPSTEADSEAEAEADVDSESEAQSEPDSDADTDDEADTEESTSTDATTASAPQADVTGHLSAAVESEHLKDFFDIADALIEEVVIEVSEDGFEFTKQDKANVALSGSELNTTAFESYDGDNLELGLNIDRTTEILSQFEDDELVHLSMTDNGRLNYKGPLLEYNQALIDPDAIADAPELPGFDNHIKIEVDKEFLERGIKAADMVSDHLTFWTTEEDFIIEADGDTDDVSLTSDGDDLEASPGEETTVMLSMDYMKDIKKALPSDTVTLELNTNQPVIFSGDLEEGEFMHMLAPRIQE
jgi:proliferating cell nuclear antigen